MNQDASHGDSLLLTGTEFAASVIRAIFQADHAEGFENFFIGCAGWQGQSRIFTSGEVFKQIQFLKDDADLPTSQRTALIVVQEAHIGFAEEDLAFGGRQQTRQEMKERRLAGSALSLDQQVATMGNFQFIHVKQRATRREHDASSAEREIERRTHRPGLFHLACGKNNVRSDISGVRGLLAMSLKVIGENHLVPSHRAQIEKCPDGSEGKQDKQTLEMGLPRNRPEGGGLHENKKGELNKSGEQQGEAEGQPQCATSEVQQSDRIVTNSRPDQHTVQGRHDVIGGNAIF